MTKDKKLPIFTIMVILAVFVIIFASMLRKPVKTEVIGYGVAENKLTADSYIIKDETLVIAPETGILNCLVDENERVARYSHIATVFVGNFPEELQIKLRNVNEKISKLEHNFNDRSVYVSDVAATENAIISRIYSVIESVYNNDLSDSLQYKNDLNKIIGNINGEKVADNTELDSLYNQKAEIEKQLNGSVSNVYAPISGLFSSKVDGYENYLSAKNISLFTPSYIKDAKNNKENTSDNAVKGLPVVKVSNNYLWYVTAIVDATWAESLNNGDAVRLRFQSISDDTYDAKVNHISQEENGQVVLVIACEKNVTNLFGVREIKADFIKNSYSGFKISKDAVRILPDGTSGVYVLKDRVARFKTIDVLYNGETYVIAKEDNSDNKNVLLYDEVILNIENIEDGKIVK